MKKKKAKGAGRKGTDVIKKISVQEVKDLKKKAIWSGFFLIIAVISLIIPMISDKYAQGNHLITGIQYLAFVLILGINYKSFFMGIVDFFRGHPDRDTLAAMGSVAAYCYGFTGNSVSIRSSEFLVGAAAILAMNSILRFAEGRLEGSTYRYINKLRGYIPSAAVVERRGRESEIPSSEIETGDILIVHSGESIAADGVIVAGNGSIDKSSFTGDLTLDNRKSGDKVRASELCVAGFIRVRCEKTVSESTISRMADYAENAGMSRGLISEKTDRMYKGFVLIAIAVSFIAALIAGINGNGIESAVVAFSSVLAVSCPSAFAFASAWTIMAGCDIGCENGIYVKSVRAMENAASAENFVIRKEGMITDGTMKVADVTCYNSDEDEIMMAASELASSGKGAVMEAVADYVPDVLREGTDAEITEARRFVKGIISGSVWIVVCGADAEKAGIDTGSVKYKIDEITDQGRIPVIIAKDGQIAGVIGAEGSERADSLKAIRALDDLNKNVVMMTSDDERTAQAIRRRLDISGAISCVGAGEGSEKISELRKAGHGAIFAGYRDGDAECIKEADFGIAANEKENFVSEGADAVVTSDRLSDAVSAVRLSMAALANIKINIWWAVLYNLIGILAASGILYPVMGFRIPIAMCAVLSAIGGLFVLLNSLRFRLFEVTGERKVQPSSCGTQMSASQKEIQDVTSGSLFPEVALATQMAQENKKDNGNRTRR